MTTTDALSKINPHIHSIQNVIAEYNLTGEKDSNSEGEDILKLISQYIEKIQSERITILHNTIITSNIEEKSESSIESGIRVCRRPIRNYSKK